MCCAFYTYSASQFGRAPLQVLKRHTWLGATALAVHDNTTGERLLHGEPNQGRREEGRYTQSILGGQEIRKAPVQAGFCRARRHTRLECLSCPARSTFSFLPDSALCSAMAQPRQVLPGRFDRGQPTIPMGHPHGYDGCWWLLELHGPEMGYKELIVHNYTTSQTTEECPLQAFM